MQVEQAEGQHPEELHLLYPARGLGQDDVQMCNE